MCAAALHGIQLKRIHLQLNSPEQKFGEEDCVGGSVHLTESVRVSAEENQPAHSSWKECRCSGYLRRDIRAKHGSRPAAGISKRPLAVSLFIQLALSLALKHTPRLCKVHNKKVEICVFTCTALYSYPAPPSISPSVLTLHPQAPPNLPSHAACPCPLMPLPLNAPAAAHAFLTLCSSLLPQA
eukprot:1146568-Pelagomonas_calceolata.AAC.3